MVAVAVGVYPLLATLEEFRLYDARVDVVVNFSVQDISACVLFGVQYHIDVGGAERLASVEDTTLGKADGDLISALTGSVPFKDLLDDGTFLLVNIHLFVFGVVAVVESARAVQTFQARFPLSASGLLGEFLAVVLVHAF